MNDSNKRTAYLCNGLDPACSDMIGCYRSLDPNMRKCCHTTNEEYAINGICKDPENHPERFEQINGEKIDFWENEPNCNFWETGVM